MNARRLALVLCCALVVGAGVAVLRGEPPRETAPVSRVRPASATVAAIDVLRAWDARRAEAWAAGDPQALRRLYTPGSRTGRQDRAALAAYADRGLRVTGARMQLLAVDVLRASDHRVTLRVTDRLSRAVARGPRGAVVLPRDRPSTWKVRLSRRAGEWRVAEVRPARSRGRR